MSVNGSNPGEGSEGAVYMLQNGCVRECSGSRIKENSDNGTTLRLNVKFTVTLAVISFAPTAAWLNQHERWGQWDASIQSRCHIPEHQRHAPTCDCIKKKMIFIYCLCPKRSFQHHYQFISTSFLGSTVNKKTKIQNQRLSISEFNGPFSQQETFWELRKSTCIQTRGLRSEFKMDLNSQVHWFTVCCIFNSLTASLSFTVFMPGTPRFT